MRLDNEGTGQVTPAICDRCGLVTCTKRTAIRVLMAHKAGGAPADMILTSTNDFMTALADCDRNSRTGMIPESDIELDARGCCALDNWDHAYDERGRSL